VLKLVLNNMASSFLFLLGALMSFPGPIIIIFIKRSQWWKEDDGGNEAACVDISFDLVRAFSDPTRLWTIWVLVHFLLPLSPGICRLSLFPLPLLWHFWFIRFWDVYFHALGSLVVFSFLQLLSFSSVLSKPLSETLTSVGTAGCPTGQQLWPLSID
jgi:hypothetical protein